MRQSRHLSNRQLPSTIIVDEQLRAMLAKLESKLAQDGMLWIVWPKKAAAVKTDLNENLVRDIGLDAGLVDIKVCAIDATWSGLKFVRRVRDRIKS